MRFRDRHQAGRLLAESVAPFAGRDPVIVAIPRGGVPVAFEVAEALEAPLETVCVRKVGAPPLRGWALGAVGEGGVVVLAEDATERMPVSTEELDRIVARKADEVAWMVTAYRGGEALDIAGRTVLVVDDGVATGRTATAAARVLRPLGPREIVLAVAVGPPDVMRALESLYDEVVCLFEPEAMQSIGTWFDDYHDVRDIEVETLLTAAARG